MAYGLKQRIGAIALDWPRYEWRLHTSWFGICNRNERLHASPDRCGVACDWQWVSELHVVKVFPSLGRRLMRRALKAWPIKFDETPELDSAPVQVSIVIGHRGVVRLPHLLATLRSIAAQKSAVCECIVVEQSNVPEIQAHLPSWVRYVHTPLRKADMPYCRSWTLNVGARLARGALLVFHDNDMLVPECYVAELWRRFREGYEVINTKRFVFYLDQAETRRFFESAVLSPDAHSESVVQNLEAGGSVAIAKDAFFAIGGYDESFVGWGGEDNEFWERAQTHRVWSYGYLPIVHLWHAAQPEKGKPNSPGADLFSELSSTSPLQRIAELTLRKFGDVERMDPEWSPPLTHRTVSHQR